MSETDMNSWDEMSDMDLKDRSLQATMLVACIVSMSSATKDFLCLFSVEAWTG